MPAQRWEDYLSLGVTEIREYGATSIQVARRLRAMLLALRESVLPAYAAAVEQRAGARSTGPSAGPSAARSTPSSPRASDRQGIGGPRALA